jgi:D-aminoacyl-tRNA deacylase
MASPRYLVVLSDVDPVARDVGALLGTGENADASVDGVPTRWIPEDAVSLRRAGPHIFDERLDVRLPEEWRTGGTVLVFPSVHRSESGYDALTVHPLGNPGRSAEVGGRPGVFVPAPARSMAGALRRLSEGSGAVGWPVCFEATHHGPELGMPAFFLEIGGRDPDHPPPPATRLLAEVVRDLREDASDHVVLGVGGGHYAPHFTDLTLRRKLAFGHILPRHTLDALTLEDARAAWAGTPGAEGVVYARAADMDRPIARGWGRRFRESEADRRGPATIPTTPPSDGARSAGT